MNILCTYHHFTIHNHNNIIIDIPMIFPGGTGGWEEEEASAGFTFFTGLTPAVAGKGGKNMRAPNSLLLYCTVTIVYCISLELVPIQGSN